MSKQSKPLQIKETVMVKACPFCGDIDAVKITTDVELMENFGDEVRGYFVVCAATNAGCGVTGPFGVTQGQAVDAWNRRA